jgi:nitrite reductase (NADH) large subunit
MCAVIEDGMQTTDQVRDCTKASSSCGGCRPMVTAIVQYALRHGKEALAATTPPVCGCTDVSHELLKASIADHSYSNKNEVKVALGWKSLSGCPTCTAAIQYYSELYHPEAAKQNFSNGTDESCSDLSVGVYPDKGAGIDAEFDSRLIGQELQSSCGSLSFPSPVRAAITSSLRNPAGVLVHDIGITGAPAGWELYAGGHSELPVKQGQLVGIAETDKDAVMLSVSCLQLYRERAEYGEPLWKWIEREGIVEIREMLFDGNYQLDLVDRAEASAITKKNEERLGESICSN